MITGQMTATVLKSGGPDRLNALEQLDAWLRTPMLVLSFVWLALVVVELVWGSSRLLEVIGTAIWIVFIIEFLVRFALAPYKLAFLKGNWLSVLALIAPAFRLLRLFRVVRFARAARGLRLVRIVGTANHERAEGEPRTPRLGIRARAYRVLLHYWEGAGCLPSSQPRR